MRTNFITFLILGIIFGGIVIYFGSKKELAFGHQFQYSQGFQFIHYDAAIYACGLISTACFITAGLVAVKQNR